MQFVHTEYEFRRVTSSAAEIKESIELVLVYCFLFPVGCMDCVEMKYIINIDIHRYKGSKTLWKQGYGKLVTGY